MGKITHNQQGGNPGKGYGMPINQQLKEKWEKIQQEYDYPVDALGNPIAEDDEETLAIWHEEGIANFMQP
jgi:hypothetical protein